MQPVIDGLAADPDNADLLADIQAIAAEYPDTETPDVAPECQQLGNEPIDVSAPSTSTEGGGSPAVDDGTFPEGVYITQSPTGEVVTQTYGDGVWRRIHEDGTVDCVSTYTVDAGRIFLTTSSDVSLACGHTAEFAFLDAAWTVDGDQLRLTDINSDPNAVAEFGLPWTGLRSTATSRTRRASSRKASTAW